MRIYSREIITETDVYSKGETITPILSKKELTYLRSKEMLKFKIRKEKTVCMKNINRRLGTKLVTTA